MTFSSVRGIAAHTRGVYEEILKTSLGHQDTSNSCVYAAVLLCALLNRFSGGSALVRGGGPVEDCGLKDSGGKLHGHYWVEGRTGNGEQYVADITADQFGYEPVIVLPLTEASLLYLAGDQRDVDEYVREIESQIAMDCSESE